jgi:class 3 adenylate cyclase
MRKIKSFLLLSVVSISLLAIISLTGGLDRIGVLWKNFILASALPPAGNFFSGALMVVLTLGIIWIALHATRRERNVIALISILLLLSGSWVAALPSQFWNSSFLNPFSGVAAIFLGLLAVVFYERTAMGSREPALRRLFGKRLRPSSFRRLVDGDLPVNFPGDLHEASLLVCTIHNHVDLMEVMSPGDYVSLMNLYLCTASDFLVDVGGYLDECSGESIRVIFGAPLPVEGAANHAAKTARAAIDLVSRLEELNRECDKRWQQRLDFRIGVNSGPMIAAAYGSTLDGRYSVSGPVVEFARHLAAACAQYGSRILAGPLSYEMASEMVEGRPIDLLQRAGSRRRVELYEFLAAKNSLSPERERSRDHFWKGVILFREKKWDQATTAFSSARISGIPDKVLDYYLERVERARRGEDEQTPEQALLTESV